MTFVLSPLIGSDTDDGIRWRSLKRQAVGWWRWHAQGSRWHTPESALIHFGYDADTGAGTDSDITPISQHDVSVTTDGSDLTIQIDSAGLLRAA